MNTFSRYLLFSIGLLLLGKFSLAQDFPFYVGTYTSNSTSEGIYIYNWNDSKSILARTIAMSNPSFLVRDNHIVYAVNEDIEGKITAYDLQTNKILSQVSSFGAHPCHISKSPIHPLLVVSNYSSGSLVAYSINENGSLKNRELFLEFSIERSKNERQSSSHIHSAFFSKDGNYLYVSDLGADCIYVFNIVKSESGYEFIQNRSIQTKSEGGPRHLVFSKDEKTLYSVLELTGEIEVFKHVAGDWKSIQLLPIFSKDFNGEHGAADIKISADGKYIFANNRGTANVVAAYKILKNGRLKLHQILSTDGDGPRNLNISPDSKFVFISNQNTNNISIFRLKKGKLFKQSEVQVPKPVCVVF